jgi:hypothetical protein
MKLSWCQLCELFILRKSVTSGYACVAFELDLPIDLHALRAAESSNAHFVAKKVSKGTRAESRKLIGVFS